MGQFCVVGHVREEWRRRRDDGSLVERGAARHWFHGPASEVAVLGDPGVDEVRVQAAVPREVGEEVDRGLGLDGDDRGEFERALGRQPAAIV